MISKRIAGRKDGRSSAANALRYGEGLTPDRETGEFLDKSHRTRLGNFGLVDDGVYAGQDMTGLIELASIEMQSAMDMNTRVAVDKKLAHVVVSFNQDKPSEAVLQDTEDSMLAALRLNSNHFATFLHNDNGYWHLHIFASRIDKTTKHLGNPLWQDQTIRDKVCKEIEIRHGLEIDNGMHEVNEAGEIVEVPREERQRRREAKPAITDRARVKEIYSGEKSFQTWATDIRIGDRLKHAKSWQDTHAAAAAYGCEIKQKGAGFVICPLGEKGAIQLSKVGLKNLPAKFGAFEAANPDRQAQREATYKPSPINAKGTGHYTSWQAAKKEFQPVKTEQINSLRESHKATRKAIKDRQSAELKTIRETTKGADKYAAVSVAKMQHAIDQATITDRFAHERQALFRQLSKSGPGNTFRDYLVKEAGDGDNVALGLARKYGADEATTVSREREAGHLQIRAAVSGNEFNPAQRMRFTHKVERTGTVVYNLGNGRVITDSATAKQIQLNSAAANDPAAIATSLRFASSKFGNTLTLTGSPGFQRLAVETAVRERIGVKFADPALEAYREKLVAEQQHRPTSISIKEKQHAPRNRIKRLEQIPPPNERERLHNMPAGDLVLDIHRDVSSLWPDVPASVDEQQGGNNHELQRPTGRTARVGTAGAGEGSSAGASATRQFAVASTRLRPASGESGRSGSERILVPVIQPTIPEPAVAVEILAIESVAVPTPLPCADWIAQQSMSVVQPYQFGSDTEYVVEHIADAIVLNHGRALAVYPIPKGVALKVGQKVVIKDGQLALPTELTLDVGKGRGE